MPRKQLHKSHKASRKSSRKSARKKSHKASRKSSRKSARKKSRKSSRKSARKSARKKSRKSSRKSARKSSRKASRKSSRKKAPARKRSKSAKKAGRKSVKKAGRKRSSKASRKQTVKELDDLLGKHAHKSTHKRSRPDKKSRKQIIREKRAERRSRKANQDVDFNVSDLFSEPSSAESKESVEQARKVVNDVSDANKNMTNALVLARSQPDFYSKGMVIVEALRNNINNIKLQFKVAQKCNIKEASLDELNAFVGIINVSNHGSKHIEDQFNEYAKHVSEQSERDSRIPELFEKQLLPLKKEAIGRYKTLKHRAMKCLEKFMKHVYENAQKLEQETVDAGMQVDTSEYEKSKKILIQMNNIFKQYLGSEIVDKLHDEILSPKAVRKLIELKEKTDDAEEKSTNALALAVALPSSRNIENADKAVENLNQVEVKVKDKVTTVASKEEENMDAARSSAAMKLQALARGRQDRSRARDARVARGIQNCRTSDTIEKWNSLNCDQYAQQIELLKDAGLSSDAWIQLKADLEEKARQAAKEAEEAAKSVKEAEKQNAAAQKIVNKLKQHVENKRQAEAEAISKAEAAAKAEQKAKEDADKAIEAEQKAKEEENMKAAAALAAITAAQELEQQIAASDADAEAEAQLAEAAAKEAAAKEARDLARQRREKLSKLMKKAAAQAIAEQEAVKAAQEEADRKTAEEAAAEEAASKAAEQQAAAKAKEDAAKAEADAKMAEHMAAVEAANAAAVEAAAKAAEEQKAIDEKLRREQKEREKEARVVFQEQLRSDREKCGPALQVKNVRDLNRQYGECFDLETKYAGMSEPLFEGDAKALHNYRQQLLQQQIEQGKASKKKQKKEKMIACAKTKNLDIWEQNNCDKYVEQTELLQELNLTPEQWSSRHRTLQKQYVESEEAKAQKKRDKILNQIKNCKEVKKLKTWDDMKCDDLVNETKLLELSGVTPVKWKEARQRLAEHEARQLRKAISEADKKWERPDTSA